MKEQNETPLTERKVVRRGLIAGLAGLGAAALMKVSGASKAHADDGATLVVGTATHDAQSETRLSADVPAGIGGPLLGPLFQVVNGGTVSVTRSAITGSANASGIGVHGLNNNGVLSLNSIAVLGQSGASIGAGGISASGIGVFAQAGSSELPPGGTGVEGQSSIAGGLGVRGINRSNGTGIKGLSNSSSGADGNGSGIGVHGKSGTGHGVLGESGLVAVKGQATGNGIGVVGLAVNNFGVYGASTNYVGLWGESATQVGISAVTNGANQPALYLLNTNPTGPTKFGALIDGNVVVSGSLQVVGNKNALVPHPDGSLRTLYCQESPEAWFEDFGRAQLVGGVARVNIDPEFATLVLRAGYMVFLTPEGDSRGLYVSRQDPNGFEVREQQAGTSTLPFAYRIVAKRKDVASPRLAKVDPKITARPAAVAAAMAPQNAGLKPTAGPSAPAPPAAPLPPVAGPGPSNTSPAVPPTQPGPPGGLTDGPRGR